MPIQFPPSAAPPPSPSTAAVIIPRSIGSLNLNDRITTFWDKLETPGTRFLQPEQLQNRDGQMAIVRVDRKFLVMTAYLLVFETAAFTFYDFTRTLEDVTEQGAIFREGAPGAGWLYTDCYASEIVGTQQSIIQLGPPLQRVMRVSFKITSRYTVRQPA